MILPFRKRAISAPPVAAHDVISMEDIVFDRGYCVCPPVQGLHAVTMFSMQGVKDVERYARHVLESGESVFIVCNRCKCQLDPERAL